MSDYKPNAADKLFVDIFLNGTSKSAALSQNTRKATGLAGDLTDDDLEILDRSSVRRDPDSVPGEPQELDVATKPPEELRSALEAQRPLPVLKELMDEVPPPAPAPKLPVPAEGVVTDEPPPATIESLFGSDLGEQAPEADIEDEYENVPTEEPEAPQFPIHALPVSDAPGVSRKDLDERLRSIIEGPEWSSPPASEISVDPPTRSEVGKLFNSESVSPLTYVEILNARYKSAWMDWEPETLWWSIRKEYGPVGELARNKIMAMRTCMKTNTPWVDWDVFENVAQAFNDNIPIFGELQPPEPEEAAYAVSILRTIADYEFGNEVSGYLAAVCLTHGIVYAPDRLFPSAQYYIDRDLQHDAKITAATAKIWPAIEARGFESLTGVSWREDNPIDSQVHRLWMIEKYIASRQAEKASEASHAGSQIRS